MKYNKELKNILNKYTYFIRQLCISYKKWKKWKPDCGCNWKLGIFIDCIKANYVPEELYNTNLKTLYKVCKRLEKRYKIPSMEYYNYITKTGLFRFTSVARETFYIIVNRDGR